MSETNLRFSHFITWRTVSLSSTSNTEPSVVEIFRFFQWSLWKENSWPLKHWSWDTSFYILTRLGYGLGEKKIFRFSVKVGISLCSKLSRPTSGLTLPSIQRVPVDASPEVRGKRPMHKDSSIPLPRGEVTNARSYIAPPHIFFGHTTSLKTGAKYLSLNPSVFCTDILKHSKVNITHCFNSEIRLRKNDVLSLF